MPKSEKQKESQQKWVKSHPNYWKQRRNQQPEYFEKRKEIDKENNKKWRITNSEKYKKYHSDWAKSNRIKMNKSQRKFYQKNKSNIAKKTAEKRKILNKIKEQYGCMNPECKWREQLPSYSLDFHHLSDKKFNLGSDTGGRSIKSLCAEIRKCIVVCAICHRAITHGKFNTENLIPCNVDDLGIIQQI